MRYQVTGAGDNLSFAGASVKLIAPGKTASFKVIPADNYELSETVEGDCPLGSWNNDIYTTGAINTDCTVEFVALGQFTVTASGSEQLTIDPAGESIVKQGDTLSVTVAPLEGYERSDSVAGDCPAGEWSGDTYTTGAITADCFVTFSVAGEYTVTPTFTNSLLTGSPAAPQLVTEGNNTSFTLSPKAVIANSVDATGAPELAYSLSQTVAGDCPQGSWDGSTYTTGEITESCSVVFSVENPCGNEPDDVSFSAVKALLETPKAKLSDGTAAYECTACHLSAGTKAALTTSTTFGNGNSADYSTITNATIIDDRNTPIESQGKVVRPFDPLNSWLYRKVSASWAGGVDPNDSSRRGARMPFDRVRLTDQQQSTICHWIFQGAEDN